MDKQAVTRRQFIKALAGAALGASAFKTAAAQEVKEFDVKIERYNFTPNLIEVNRGDLVRLHLTSSDVQHGFFLDGYDINEIVNALQKKTIEFTANRAGSFQYRCSVVCGPYHPIIRGKFTVKPNTRYWASLAIAALVPFGTLAYLMSRYTEETPEKKGDESAD